MEKKLIKRKLIMDFFDYRLSNNEINSFNDKDYILWLDDFMQENVFFSNFVEQYVHSDLSIYDLTCMEQLPLFYNIVLSYAKNIGLTAYEYENNKYFLFRYNNYVYRLNLMDGGLYTCQKLTDSEKLHYEIIFDYYKIRNFESFKKKH